MSKDLIQETMGQEYHQFLGDLGQAICDKISNDQGIEALKQLQNKQYLLQRIKQIIEAIYEVKNQQAFSKQAEQIQQQRITIIQQENQLKKLARMYQTHQQSFCQEKDKDQAHNELSKQNWQLNKRLIQQDQQNKLRVKQFSQTIKIMERQQQANRVAFTNQLSSAIQGIKLWEQKYKTLYQQKGNLETALQQQLERHLQEQMRTKELNQQKQELNLNVQKMTKLNKSMKDQVDRLQDKVLRLEKNKQSLQEQIKTYQQEIKALKKVNEQINDNSFYKKERKQSHDQTRQLIKNLKQVQEQQQKAESQQKLRKIFELQKKVQKNKLARNQTQIQFHDYKLSAQKQLFQLQQELNELKIKHEKQIRIMKQTFLQQKQNLLKSHEQKMKDNQQTTTQNYSYQTQEMQKTLKISQQKVLKYKSQVKDLETFMHQKQLHYNDTLHDLEKKNEEFRSYIKQLQKAMKQKSSSSNDFLKQYSLKVETCQQQVDHYRKQNEKLRKQIELIRKELDRSNLSLMTQRNKQSTILTQRKLNDYKRQDFEQYIKTISDLKQKIMMLQSQQKYIQKENKQKSDMIGNLKVLNEKLQQKCDKYKQSLVKIQKQLVISRKDLTQLQVNHNKQLSDNYKNYEYRIQNEKKVLVSHYEQLLKNRQQRLDQCRNSRVIFEHQLTIINLRSSLQSMRDKSLGLQQKIQQFKTQIKQLHKQLSIKQSRQQQLKDELVELSRQLFNCRQQRNELQRNIRQKLKMNQLMFRQFKFQIDNYIRKQLSQLRSIIKIIVNQINSMKSLFNHMKNQFTTQFYSQFNKYQSQVNQQIKSIKSHYQHQVNINHKIQLQQLQQQYHHKCKQKQIQFMSQIASRQYALKQLQKQFNNTKSINQKIQYNLKIKSQENHKIKQQFNIIKQVNQKINQKTNKLEKLLIQNQRDILSLQNDNKQLKDQILQTQHMYQNKLDQCRDKYIQENQKLFYKYQKEFDKLITMNSKVKNTALSSMMLNNIAPTKQYEMAQTQIKTITKQNKDYSINNKDYSLHNKQYAKQPISDKKQSKLESIKKQILLQKKKLQGLDSTKSKIPIKGSTSTTNLLKHKKMLD